MLSFIQARTPALLSFIHLSVAVAASNCTDSCASDVSAVLQVASNATKSKTKFNPYLQHNDLFVLIQDGGPYDGRFCADEGDKIECNRQWIGSWETFEAHRAPNGRFGFNGGRRGKWCADDGSKNNQLICNRDRQGSWETFDNVNYRLSNSGSSRRRGRRRRNNLYNHDHCGTSESNNVMHCRYDGWPVVNRFPHQVLQRGRSCILQDGHRISLTDKATGKICNYLPSQQGRVYCRFNSLAGNSEFNVYQGRRRGVYFTAPFQRRRNHCRIDQNQFRCNFDSPTALDEKIYAAIRGRWELQLKRSNGNTWLKVESDDSVGITGSSSAASILKVGFKRLGEPLRNC